MDPVGAAALISSVLVPSASVLGIVLASGYAGVGGGGKHRAGKSQSRSNLAAAALPKTGGVPCPRTPSRTIYPGASTPEKPQVTRVSSEM